MQHEEKHSLWELILKNKLDIEKNIDSVVIKADGYYESDILKILQEIHPEWEIVEIKNKENEPTIEYNLSSG